MRTHARSLAGWLLVLASLSSVSLGGCLVTSSEDDGAAGGVGLGDDDDGTGARSGGGDDTTTGAGNTTTSTDATTSGDVTSSGDATSGGPGFATLTVDWSVLAYDGAAIPCASPYDKIVVSAQAVDRLEAPNSPLGDPFERIYDCSAGSAAIALPVSGDSTDQQCLDAACSGAPAEGITGAYFVTAFITDASGEIRHLISPILESFSQPRAREEADLATGDASLHFDFHPDAGFELVSWFLQAASDVTPLSCAAANVDEITLRTRLRQDENLIDVPDGYETITSFPCTGQPGVDFQFADGAGVSHALPPGYYEVELLAKRGGETVGRRADNDDPGLRHVAAGEPLQAIFPDVKQALLIEGF